MSFLDKILHRSAAREEGGADIENYMTLVRVYFQAAIAANVGITNLAVLPDLRVFKNTFRVATQNNKLGLAERTRCRRMMSDMYGTEELFFREIDQSVKRGCRRMQDVQVYMLQFQQFTQDLMMLTGNLMKFKLRLPSFFKNALRQMTEKTVQDIFTKDDYKDAATMKTVLGIRQYAKRLGFSQPWTSAYVFQLVMLAKKAKRPSADE